MVKKLEEFLADEEQIDFGKEVECQVTGFRGIVTGRFEYINGCVQWGVRPKASIPKDASGKMEFPDAQYIDEAQLKVVGPGVSVQIKARQDERAEVLRRVRVRQPAKVAEQRGPGGENANDLKVNLRR